MKKILNIVIFIIICCSVFSDDNFRIDLDIEDLHKLSASEWNSLIENDTQLFLEGAFNSLYQVSEDPVIYEGNLVNGEWIGLEELKVYNVKVRFIGEEWNEKIGNRRNKNRLTINSFVRIFGSFSGSSEEPVFMVNGVK